ncbi:MAG: hypothetical protein ACOYOB_19585 [Myxococcota bacterium]
MREAHPFPYGAPLALLRRIGKSDPSITIAGIATVRWFATRYGVDEGEKQYCTFAMQHRTGTLVLFEKSAGEFDNFNHTLLAYTVGQLAVYVVPGRHGARSTRVLTVPSHSGGGVPLTLSAWVTTYRTQFAAIQEARTKLLQTELALAG